MNLSDARNREKFLTMLTYVEGMDAKSNGVLTNWEREFVVNLRARFDAREDQLDMGMTPWNPTVNQWNTLHGIGSKLR